MADSSLINSTIDRGQHVVLVVDDNPATRYSTERVIRAAGFQTREAASGEEALALTTSGVSAVILDVHLPDMNGFDICRAVRAAPATATLPVIHLSAAFVKDEDKVTGLNAGADAYLIHPVEPAILIATLQALVRARMAEDRQRRSEVRFRAIYDQAPSAMALIDAEGRFVDANPAMVGLLGRPRAALLGRPVSAFAAAGSAALVQEKTGGGQPPDASWHGDFALLHSDGHTVDLEWSMSPHIEPGVRVGIAQDVSERMQLARRRHEVLEREQAARAVAERHSRTKDDFIAVLSHELRTPLNAIVSWVDVLSRPAGAGMMARGLAVIERNARTQARIISDILDVARINSGKLRLEREWANAADLVNTTIDSLRPQIDARRLTVEREFSGDLQAVWLDAARFQQVVSNLLTNAIKFSASDARVHLGLRRSGQTLELVVRDFGQGIRADFLPQLFERFTQSDSPGNRRHGGLGLGLSIVKHLVELHGGTVSADSAGEGQGTSVTVRLPVQRAGVEAFVDVPDEAAGESLQAKVPLVGCSVLVVDDDADTLETLSMVLGEVGAIVATASSYQAALDALDSLWPDLLVSDIGLAGHDGYELIEEVRRRQAARGRPPVPSLALTAFARPEDRARALAAGFDQHLGKPASPHTIVDLLAALHHHRGRPARPAEAAR